MRSIGDKMEKYHNILQGGMRMKKKLEFYLVNSFNYLATMETLKPNFNFLLVL